MKLVMAHFLLVMGPAR
jgi:hypothetical protein